MEKTLEQVLEDGTSAHEKFVSDGRMLMLAHRMGKLDEYLTRMWERDFNGDSQPGNAPEA